MYHKLALLFLKKQEAKFIRSPRIFVSAAFRFCFQVLKYFKVIVSLPNF